MSIRHHDDLNTYNDELDELEEFLNYQLEPAKFRIQLLYSRGDTTRHTATPI